MVNEQTTHFTIGSVATCTDGDCGRVTRVVVDPVARTVTHLVVEPKNRRGVGRLVALDLLDGATEGVRLRCTMHEFQDLQRAEEAEFLAPDDGYMGYGSGEVFAWPYFIGSPGIGMGRTMNGGNRSQPIIHDVLPEGEVGVRRGEAVHATDGDIGHVHGIVMDPATRRVTHVLLQEGHLWGSKEVAIPIDAVTRVDAGIRLTLSKVEVEGLPAVVLDHGKGPAA